MNNHKQQWEKMNQSKNALAEEFKDKKFGMFIHFGVYAMLAGEWQGERIEQARRPHVAEWIMHAFKISRNDYNELAKKFNPKNFCGEAVAMLAKNAGMKYIVITSKHHDGFCLYDSDCSDYNITKSKYGKDLVMELYTACKKHGIEFGLYYSHSIDWMDGGDGGMLDYKNNENRKYGLHAYNEWDRSPVSYDDYIKDKAIPQVKEILNKFPNMSNIWFDVPYYIPEKYSYEFYKTVYDIQPQILISQRIGNGYGDVACPGDNVIPEDPAEYEGAWETVGTMNNSWGFKHYDHDWKYPKETLFWLIEIVSKGGNYMLNIGPDSEGNVPKENIDILTTIGSWLKVNGEAVYGTRVWDTTHEGPTSLGMGGTNSREEEGFNTEFSTEDFWFTKKENCVYCISLYSGSTEKIEIASIKDCDIKAISLLSDGSSLQWEKMQTGIKITMPDSFVSEIGFAVKVEMK